MMILIGVGNMKYTVKRLIALLLALLLALPVFAEDSPF